MVPVKLRRAKGEDANAIVDLFREVADKELDVNKIADCVDKYPSVVALSGNELVGFVYSSSFAPDILELLNIAVLEAYRGSDIGSMMLCELEKQACPKYRSVILVNSVLYPSKKPKKLASNFYIKNGYNMVHATGSTNVFVKSLA